MRHEVQKFKWVRRCTNKTGRYPGYCEKVDFPDECGLLSRTPIEFKGHKVVPFEVSSKIIYPKVRLEEGEKGITVLRVVVEGVKNGCETCYTFDMVDFYDDDRGVTSMAKTTSYTACMHRQNARTRRHIEKGPRSSCEDRPRRPLPQASKGTLGAGRPSDGDTHQLKFQKYLTRQAPHFHQSWQHRC